MAFWYADSSAFVKLFLDERESDALARHASELAFSSELLGTEVVRVARRVGREATAIASILLSRVWRLPITAEVLAKAAAIVPADLGTLDAIHLATALEHRNHITGIATYDEALAAAAHRYGLAVLAPR